MKEIGGKVKTAGAQQPLSLSSGTHLLSHLLHIPLHFSSFTAIHYGDRKSSSPLLALPPTSGQFISPAGVTPPRLSPCMVTSAHHSVMDAALGDLNPIPHRCLSADLLGTLPWPGHLSSPHGGISDRPQPCMGSAEITLQKTSHWRS